MNYIQSSFLYSNFYRLHYALQSHVFPFVYFPHLLTRILSSFVFILLNSNFYATNTPSLALWKLCSSTVGSASRYVLVKHQCLWMSMSSSCQICPANSQSKRYALSKLTYLRGLYLQQRLLESVVYLLKGISYHSVF